MNTKHNWINVPKEVTHIAMDRNLSIYGYYGEPEINEEYECWNSRRFLHSPCYLGKGVVTDWRNSLEERPSFDDIIESIDMAISYILKDSTLSKNCAIEVCKELNIN